MSSWSEIIKYVSKNNDQVKKATQLLKQFFGIKYFTYHRIDNAGNFTVLLDRPDWAEHYISEKFYLVDAHQRHPRFFKSGILLIDSSVLSRALLTNIVKDPVAKQAVESTRNVFSMDLGVTVIEKSDDCVEFFGFGASRSTSTLENLYLTQPSLLKEYGLHFKKELHATLEAMEPGFMPDLKGDAFFSGEVLDPGLSVSKHHDFLSQIGHASAVEKIKLLSPREKQCLVLLLEYQSAKDIASQLGNLSFRTIEFYFENIKSKLNCSTRSQLFSLAKKLYELGLIP
jgi:DNA-binding CsgD family transcriptional regulator